MIAVIGGYGQGLTMRVARSPEAGETVAGGVLSSDHGGKGSNQAVAVCRLAASAVLVSAVGDDDAGRSARELWASEGVVDHVSTIPGERTMTGFILVEPSGENRISIADGALAAMTPAHVDVATAAITAARVALVSLEIPHGVARRALEIARDSGTRTVLNPAPATAATASLLPFADVLTPNRGELAALAGVAEPRDDDEVAAACVALRASGYRGAIVVTLGSGGAYVDADGVQTRIAPVRVTDVVDTTGAGDAFSAALAVALDEGEELADAARFAVRAGAFAVTREQVIPSLPHRHELDTLAVPQGEAR